MLRMILHVLLALAVIYIGLCALLFFFQGSFLYFPTPAGNVRANVITLQNSPERVYVSTHPNAGPQAVIYFGGNAEDVTYNLPGFRETFPGHALFLLNYRGYGGSGGTPTEEALFADALALYEQVRTAHPDIVLIGRSLGSGLAVRLASLRPARRLILVTPFDSVHDIAARAFPFFPVRLLLQEKYESWRYAPQVTAPTLIIAAEHDEVVPRASTELLRTRFRPDIVQYVVVPGSSHNDINYLPLLSTP